MTNTTQPIDPLYNPKLRPIIDKIIEDNVDLDGGLMVVLNTLQSKIEETMINKKPCLKQAWFFRIGECTRRTS